MSTLQINSRLASAILGSLVVHGCLFFGAMFLTLTEPKKIEIYSLSLRSVKSGASVHSPERVMLANPIVMPAKAGIHRTTRSRATSWMPAFAGMTNPGSSGLDPASVSLKADLSRVDLSRSANPAHIVKPEFTKRAIEHEVEGEVDLHVTIGPDGTVQNAEITKRIGYGLDEKALSAMLQSTFEPARDSDGNAVISHVMHRYKFTITNP